MRKTLLLLLPLIAIALASYGQNRDKTLTISVTTTTGDALEGQAVRLMQTDYSLSYGDLRLDAAGQCQVRVYAGNHEVTVDRDGYETASATFAVAVDATEATVALQLEEKTKTPFALEARVHHDAYEGTNQVTLSWNTEPPAFFDDFENYDAFAVQFGEWTGIDADMEAAAPLLGDYPNRGVLQYAQVINPLAVTPTWWYDYPILRPYDGKQYVGFTRTNSGNANDDWLISPTVEVGTEHALMFMAKAADQYAERFQVYVTTNTEHPVQADFVRLDAGNYETADFTGWRQCQYDLSAYAGQQVKFAIRYISHYNLYSSFMLMVDNVYVGQPRTYGQAIAKAKARRTPRRSEANPNERFLVYLDGQQVGETEAYSHRIDGVATGTHTVGVKAVYLASESATVTTEVTIADTFSPVTFLVEADSQLAPDGQVIHIVSTDTSESYETTVADGRATIASLPHGDYVARVEEGAYEEVQQAFYVTGATEVRLALSDRLVTPYNITADQDEEAPGTVALRWNQELLFTDSFEDYDDFATGTFGPWKSIDGDHLPVYPIALGEISNVISFPGSGTASNPQPLAPIVFNPWNTTPAMLPTDPAVTAPTGNKTIAFFSPQRGMADKWLISPEIDIHEGYMLSCALKSYDPTYLESVEFCLSTGGDTPEDFTPISQASRIPAGEWTVYQTGLSDYAGQKVRLAVHYVSYDTFFLQLDDFTVGSESGEGETVDYGNVVRYDIYVDGAKVAETARPTYTLTGLGDGEHTVGIVAVYRNGQSEMGTITIHVSTGIARILLDGQQPQTLYDISGRHVGDGTSPLPRGLYIMRQGNRHQKILQR